LSCLSTAYRDRFPFSYQNKPCRFLNSVAILVAIPSRADDCARATAFARSACQFRPARFGSGFGRSSACVIGREGQPHLGKRRLEVGELDRQRPHGTLEIVNYFSEDPAQTDL
jgi:hypothetical protein